MKVTINHIYGENNRMIMTNPEEIQETAKGFQKLLEEFLMELYGAENAILKAIPKFIQKANSNELTMVLGQHQVVTEGHAARIEEIFGILGIKITEKKSEAMEGLIKEALQLINEKEKGVLCDAAIILSQQKIEHYEIATYGTLCAYSMKLGLFDIAGLLSETLIEEKEADELLTGVSELTIQEMDF